ATAQLKEAFKDPSVVPALCSILANSPNPQIRQFAAVLVRRRVAKHWKKLSVDLKEKYGTNLLNRSTKITSRVSD
ncbi:hypothetical protein chiPu_0023808, partial [Chiloscyllium punctatum]|nr:hypothetical protein [Chiloscyllium punctatum]